MSGSALRKQCREPASRSVSGPLWRRGILRMRHGVRRRALKIHPARHRCQSNCRACEGNQSAMVGSALRKG